MTYASPVWWTGMKTHANILTRVQNKSLRHICAAFRTTPIKALEIEASIPPINLFLDHANDNAATRLLKLPSFNPVLQRLDQPWRQFDLADPPPALPTDKYHPRSRKPPKSTRLTRLSKRASPDVERINIFALPPWANTVGTYCGRLTITDKQRGGKKEAAKAHIQTARNLQSEDKHLLVYSDGSKQSVGEEERAGAGWAGYHRGREVFWGQEGMGPKAEVYDAEMLALLQAISQAICFAQDSQVTHLYFFVDNNSVVQAAYTAAPGPSQYIALQIRHSIEDFLTTSSLHHIQIAWIPGHHNIVGNERADELAKEATGRNDMSHSTYANARRRNKEGIRQKWTESWHRDVATQTGRFAIANRLPPTLKPRQHFTHTPREVYGRLIQCRTGHGFMGEYYATFVPTEPTRCPCGEPRQTREHILRDCPQFTRQRIHLREVSYNIILNEILGTEKGIKALATFIKESSAFKKAALEREGEWEERRGIEA